MGMRKPASFRPRSTPTAPDRERQYDRDRGKQAGRQLYKQYRWQKERAAFLSLPENQFCIRCKVNGLLNPGTFRKDGTVETNKRRMHLVVNHKVRHHGDLELFWSWSNWEPLCPDHHDIDVQAEEKAAALR